MDDHDLGLQHDLVKVLDRRRALQVLGGAVAFAFLGACARDAESPQATGTTSTSTSTSSSMSTSTSTSSAACEEIPAETAGPFPGDGSNGPDVLRESGIVRSDITEKLGSLRGTADGVPLVLELTVQDTAKGCAPLAGAAVYVWQCDRNGRYCCTPTARPTRTTCGACRRPTPTDRFASRASSRRRTRVAGPTCTSRSTGRSRAPQTASDKPRHVAAGAARRCVPGGVRGATAMPSSLPTHSRTTLARDGGSATEPLRSWRRRPEARRRATRRACPSGSKPLRRASPR